MSELPQKEFLEYMKTAIEVETDVATQERFLNQCCDDIQRRKPTLDLEDIPSSPVYEEGKPELGYFFIGLGVFLGFILYGISGEFWLSLFTAGGFAAMGWLGVKAGNEQNTIAQRGYNDHEKLVKEIRERNEQAKRAHDTAVWQCDESIRAIKSVVIPKIEEAKNLREKLYDKNMIYRKYCTLPALTSIYEYFVTGRCTELTGPHGAYNLYEDELRKDTVISQLNAVIENLEQIKQNQYMLYQQVKAIQENTFQIVSEVRQIRGYTVQIAQLAALNAYYAARTERNTRISMYYQM